MFTEQVTRAAPIAAPAANSTTKTDLVKKVRTLWFQFRVRARVTLGGGPATSILNRGSVLCGFDRLGIDEGGTRMIDADPRLLQMASQMLAPRDTDHGRVRLTQVADGAYNLEESVFLPFSSVQVAGPTESVYLERNPEKEFKAFVQRAADSLVNRIVATPGTAVIDNITVEVVQRYDLERNKRTVLLPVIRQLEQVIAGASTRFPFKIDSTSYLQGMIVQQDTQSRGEVTDIINRLALRADGRDFIGPDPVPYEELQAAAQMEFSGDVVSGGYLPIWFRKGGRLGNIVNANSLANFRLDLDCQPSVVAGAGTSIVRVLLLELVAVPGLTVPPPFRI